MSKQETGTITIIGMNHKTASLEERERVQRIDIATWLRGTLYPQSVTEFVILNTCNRTEVYFIGSHISTAAERVEAVFASPHLYRYENAEAVKHLFMVTAGLDSMVVGESDIVAQIREAYQEAAKDGVVGPILNQLFQRAVHASKVVRTKTKIGSGITSVARYAVLQMRTSLPEFPEAEILVIGAGKMGKKVVSYLHDEHASHVTIANRSLAPAVALAAPYGDQAVSLEALDAQLRKASVVFTATAAKEYVFQAELVAEVMRSRPDRPLFICDIAVPRNVDPAVSAIPGVHLRNMDNLHVEQTKRARTEAAHAAEQLLDTEIHDFYAWWESREHQQVRKNS
jgi:glutamyl-tRNA reductase